MSKTAKISLIVATILVVAGAGIFVAAMSQCNWDFTKLSTVKYETNAYTAQGDFDNISIDTATADILFVPSEDDSCKVVCYEQEKVKHSVKVENNTLVIKVKDERKWYEHFGIYVDSPKLTVYLPDEEYDALVVDESTGKVQIPEEFAFESIDITASTGAVSNYANASGDIKITTSTGKITVKGVSADNIELSVSTGKVEIEDVTVDGDVKIDVSTGRILMTDVRCENVISTGSTGDMSLKNVIASEKMSIDRSTGDISLEGADAEDIIIETSTGKVRGTLLTEKEFITDTSTGDIDVPKDGDGGKCVITTSTGDIEISIVK